MTPHALRVFLTRLGKAPQWLRLLLRALLVDRKSDFAATSMDLCDDPSLQTLIGARPRFASRLLPGRAPTLIGWGRKWSGRRAAEKAKNQKVLLTEDGFLHSVHRQDRALSMVFDDQGMYYDASKPSQLEALIQSSLTPAETARADQLIDAWDKAEVSKYNGAPEYDGLLPDDYVLVVDQVAGDASIQFGQAGPAAFDRMLRAALADNPDSQIVLKVHPDIYTHARKGHFDLSRLQRDDRVQIIAENCHPVRLIRQARAVYTVTSQMGFEALIWGKPVHCFGCGFYAGYGLTTDHSDTPPRRSAVSLQQLVHAALVRYPRYIDPATGALGEVETVLEHLGHQRRQRAQTTGEVYALGFSPWKRSFLRAFLGVPNVRFVKHAQHVPDDTTLAVWGQHDVSDVSPRTKVLRVEDGFLRSIGLGAELTQPMSWVVDDLGIYYDPRLPCRLETSLQAAHFDDDMLDRARALTASLRLHGLSKYNLLGFNWTRPAQAQRVILVPGQVENDASVRCGSPDIQTNMGLLCAVRAANPDAYILYKPHPDVAAGLRLAGKGDGDAARHCDEVIEGVDSTKLLDAVDELHTMTSLMGFEALLRGVSVTCYGQPFYAGWGLTTDRKPICRRTTQLSLDQLVAGALIDYPRYVSRTSGQFTTPEQAIAELQDWRAAGERPRASLRRLLRPILRLWAQSGLRRNA